MASHPQAETAETALQNETDGVGALLAALGHGDEIEIERITPLSDKGYLTSIPVEHGLDLKTECQRAFGGGTYLAKCKRRLPDGRYQWIKGSARFTISGPPKAIRPESSAIERWTPPNMQGPIGSDMNGRLLDIIAEKLKTPGENIKEVAASILEVVQGGQHAPSDPLDGIVKAAETYARLKKLFGPDRKSNPDDDDGDDEDDKLDDDNIVNTLGSMFIKNMMGGKQQEAAPSQDGPPGWVKVNGQWVQQAQDAPPGWMRAPNGQWVLKHPITPRLTYDEAGRELRYDYSAQAWRYHDGTIFRGASEPARGVQPGGRVQRNPPPASRPHSREDFPQPRTVKREVPLQFAKVPRENPVEPAAIDVEKQEVREPHEIDTYATTGKVTTPADMAAWVADRKKAIADGFLPPPEGFGPPPPPFTIERDGWYNPTTKKWLKSEIDNRNSTCEFPEHVDRMPRQGNPAFGEPEDIVTNPSRSVRMGMEKEGLETGTVTTEPRPMKPCPACRGEDAHCAQCGGTGIVEDRGTTCGGCNGSGEITRASGEVVNCPNCEGTGWRLEEDESDEEDDELRPAWKVRGCQCTNEVSDNWDCPVHVQVEPCPECNGQGHLLSDDGSRESCECCDGRGRVLADEDEEDDEGDVMLSEATPDAIAEEIANMDPDEQVETLALLGPTFGIDSATMRDLVRQAQAQKKGEGSGNA